MVQSKDRDRPQIKSLPIVQSNIAMMLCRLLIQYKPRNIEPGQNNSIYRKRLKFLTAKMRVRNLSLNILCLLKYIIHMHLQPQHHQLCQRDAYYIVVNLI